MVRGGVSVPRQWRREFWRAFVDGVPVALAAAAVGVSTRTVQGWIAESGGVPDLDLAVPTGRFVSFEERERMALLRAEGHSYAAIGRWLGRPRSTVWRELTNPGRRASDGRYVPSVAQAHRDRQAARPKQDRRKLALNSRLAGYVTDRLDGTVRPDSRRARVWSPQQIANRLPVDFPDDESMRISHEAIYQALYVQGRGGLRAELHTALRTGRARRRPRAQARTKRQGQRLLPADVLISERPAEVADRAVPGHWEGDLIIGAGNRSAIGTLVERSTRFVMLLHLPHGYAAEQVAEAMRTKIRTLPEHLRRTLTWDRGREMTPNVGIDIGFTDPVDLFFCDPHAPWQRGSNENTNGLLRQYYPKGTDLSVHPASDLEDVADALNTRPRQTLGWATPAEKLTALLSPT